MFMTLDQLRYALELQKTRHFSKAAENCFITQPSLSVQIAKLEEELGVPLFVRTRAGVEVTEYGTELLRQARQVVEAAGRMPELASELKGEVRGHFRLGIISTLAPSLLPRFIGAFTERYPQLVLTITEERTEHLVRDIDEGRLDGAILSTPSRCPGSLMERVLFYEPFTIFASQGHPILEKKRVGLDQISADDVLLLDDTHCLRDQVLQICRAKQKPRDRRLRMQSASLQTLVELIRHGEGYTLLPALSADLLGAAERQANVRQLEKPLPARKVSLVFHRSRVKRSAIDALKSEIVASLPKNVFLTQGKGDLRVLSPGPEYFEL